MNIIELAKEAGIMESQMWSIKGLERFAALIKAENNLKIKKFLRKKEDEYELLGREQWALCLALIRAEIGDLK